MQSSSAAASIHMNHSKPDPLEIACTGSEDEEESSDHLESTMEDIRREKLEDPYEKDNIYLSDPLMRHDID